MYLIDGSYFTRDLVIPNSAPSRDIPGNEMLLDDYIDKYARQLLQNALGNVLFDELDSQIENGVLKDDAPEKWKNLVNGKSYSHNEKDLKWKGLIYSEGAFKGSILSFYVYYHWHLDQLSRMSGMGEVKGKAVNTVNVSGTNRSVKVWNEYIKMYQNQRLCDDYKFSYVDGVPFHDYYNQRESDYVCLLDFLSHHKEDYPKALMMIEREGFNNTLGL